MNLKIIIVLLLSTILLSACYHNEVDAKKESSGTETLQLSGNVIDGVRVVEVEAYKFGFSPENIVVQQGEKVKIVLTTRDVTHGILASDLNINMKVVPGQKSVAEFFADSKGNFPFRCNVYCGSGHSKMKGLIIVE
jgi:heme/copper-type cytochrome/quinol oxidase subunit 2